LSKEPASTPNAAVLYCLRFEMGREQLTAPEPNSTSRSFSVITGDVLRRCAAALPEVEEFTYFRFGVPLWKVRGKTFAGLGSGATTAVFCVSPDEAAAAAADDPATYEVVHRSDARRSFLGLSVQSAAVSEERVRELIEHAWRHKAPRRLVLTHDCG
jgi:hypothetical protein